MFSAIVITTASVKNLNLFKFKKDMYEVNYTTVLSLKAMLENREFSETGGKFTGEINGYDYEILYKPKESRRTFVSGETARNTGNIGPYNMTLYDCVLNLSHERAFSDYSFEILKYKEVVTNEFE